MDFAERVAALERSNRRMRRSLVLAAGLGLNWALPGSAPSSGVVEATRIALVDDQGRERPVLEMAESGGPHLILVDSDGALQVGLSASPGGVRGLALFDGESTRAAVTADAGGAATVGMEAGPDCRRVDHADPRRLGEDRDVGSRRVSQDHHAGRPGQGNSGRGAGRRRCDQGSTADVGPALRPSGPCPSGADYPKE